MYHVETLDALVLAADARGIAELIVKVWPKSGKSVELREQQILDLGKGYQGSAEQTPRSIVIREAGRVIAHAALIPRTISTSAGELTIAGLARVCSDPDFRGQGLGELVVREIFGLVDKQIFSFSLFQTSSMVQPFYEKLGACLVTNRIVNSRSDDPQASPFWDQVVLRYPKDRPWPEGVIDMRGPGY